MNDYFERLYRYNEWANIRVMDSIEASNFTQDAEIMLNMSHLLSAQEIWISRINSIQAPVKVWDTYTLPECRKLCTATTRHWLAFIIAFQEEDLYRLIGYKNTQRNYYETPVIDMITHAVNHATYHRAQIARMIRERGAVPVNTDFITYSRAVELLR